MEKVKFLNQTDFKEILKQGYLKSSKYLFANPMVLLNYLSSFNGETILKIDVNDDRFTYTLGLFLDEYLASSMSFQTESFEFNSFHMLYNIPILIRFITSVTNIDLSRVLKERCINGYKLSKNRIYEHFIINEIYKRHGVNRSITQMDIINFGLNEVITLNKISTDFDDYDIVYDTLQCTVMAMIYYIKYRKESDSILDYFANFITQNNLQEIFYGIESTSTITKYLKNVLVLDFNYSEYQANIYIEEFCNKCTNTIK